MPKLRHHATFLLALGLAASPLVARADGPARAPLPGEITPAQQAEADKLFAEGRELAQLSRWKEACEKFEAANKLDPLAAGTKLNLGLCYEEQGKYHTALKWFRQAQVRAAETNLADHEQAAKAHTVKLAAMVPSVAIEMPAGVQAQVTIDGEAVSASDYGHVEVDPGHHVLVAVAGKQQKQEEFDISTGATGTVRTIKVRLEARHGDKPVVYDLEDPGRYRRIAAYSLGGAAVVLWGVTAYYALDKRSLYKCLQSETNAGCGDNTGAWNDANADGGKPGRERASNKVHDDLNLYGTTLFVAGVIAAGAAVTLYVTAGDRKIVETATRLTPVVTPDQAGFALTGRF